MKRRECAAYLCVFGNLHVNVGWASVTEDDKGERYTVLTGFPRSEYGENWRKVSTEEISSDEEILL